MRITTFLILCAVATAVLLPSPGRQATAADAAMAVGPDRSLAPIRDEDQPSRAYLGGRNLPSHGVALEGYCPVAYFAAKKALRGRPEHNSTHGGVTYHFVSGDAKRAFDKNPGQYVPAFGGWCAFGMSKGDKFPVDPLSFKIEKGRLMLFLKNTGVDARSLWNRGNVDGQIAKAEAHWKKVRG